MIMPDPINPERQAQEAELQRLRQRLAILDSDYQKLVKAKREELEEKYQTEDYLKHWLLKQGFNKTQRAAFFKKTAEEKILLDPDNLRLITERGRIQGGVEKLELALGIKTTPTAEDLASRKLDEDLEISASYGRLKSDFQEKLYQDRAEVLAEAWPDIRKTVNPETESSTPSPFLTRFEAAAVSRPVFNQEVLDKIVAQSLVLLSERPGSFKAPYFVEQVQKNLEIEIGLLRNLPPERRQELAKDLKSEVTKLEVKVARKDFQKISDAYDDYRQEVEERFTRGDYQHDFIIYENQLTGEIAFANNLAADYKRRGKIDYLEAALVEVDRLIDKKANAEAEFKKSKTWEKVKAKFSGAASDLVRLYLEAQSELEDVVTAGAILEKILTKEVGNQKDAYRRGLVDKEVLPYGLRGLKPKGGGDRTEAVNKWAREAALKELEGNEDFRRLRSLQRKFLSLFLNDPKSRGEWLYRNFFVSDIFQKFVKKRGWKIKLSDNAGAIRLDGAQEDIDRFHDEFSADWLRLKKEFWMALQKLDEPEREIAERRRKIAVLQTWEGRVDQAAEREFENVSLGLNFEIERLKLESELEQIVEVKTEERVRKLSGSEKVKIEIAAKEKARRYEQIFDMPFPNSSIKPLARVLIRDQVKAELVASSTSIYSLKLREIQERQSLEIDRFKRGGSRLPELIDLFRRGDPTAIKDLALIDYEDLGAIEQFLESGRLIGLEECEHQIEICEKIIEKEIEFWTVSAYRVGAARRYFDQLDPAMPLQEKFRSAFALAKADAYQPMLDDPLSLVSYMVKIKERYQSLARHYRTVVDELDRLEAPETSSLEALDEMLSGVSSSTEWPALIQVFDQEYAKDDTARDYVRLEATIDRLGRVIQQQIGNIQASGRDSPIRNLINGDRSGVGWLFERSPLNQALNRFLDPDSYVFRGEIESLIAGLELRMTDRAKRPAMKEEKRQFLVKKIRRQALDLINRLLPR